MFAAERRLDMFLARFFNRVRFGAMLDKQGVDGETILTRAVKIEDYDAVCEFVRLGADADMANAKGESPVGLALSQRHDGIFRYLVEHGVNLAVKHDGSDLFHVAAENGMKDAARVIEDALRLDDNYAKQLNGVSVVMSMPLMPPDRGHLFKRSL